MDALVDAKMTEAVVLAEGCLGQQLGKTANGLVLHAMEHEVLAVIDSTRAGLDAGEVVAGTPLGIPVVEDLDVALQEGDPGILFLGAATVGGTLPDPFVEAIEGALDAGMDVVHGMHARLEDDPRFAEKARANGASIVNVRLPPEDLRVADGRVLDLDLPRVVVMGTDCAIGKRTTTAELVHEARDRGIDAAFVATGQTGRMLGPDAGAPIDAIPSDFCAGEVERMLEQVQDHDIAFVEGQGSILHPAYSAPSLGILHGAAPHAVVLAHDPVRKQRTMFDHPAYQVAPVSKEIELIEGLGTGEVVAVAVNGKNSDDVAADEDRLQRKTGLPAIDPIATGPGPLLDAVLDHLVNRDIYPEAREFVKAAP